MTPRQSKLLKAIINEFIDSAEAVGSVHLAEKYALGVSPATIRNEMAELSELGFLEKQHSSSGRIPTNLAFRYFLESLLKEFEEIELAHCARIKESLFQARFNKYQLVNNALQILSSETKLATLFSFSDHVVRFGSANLLLNSDYQNITDLYDLFNIIDDNNFLREIFNKFKNDSEKSVKVLIGEDSGFGYFASSSILFSSVRLHKNEEGFLALIGPNRMNYAKNIPFLEFIAENINYAVAGW